MVVINHCGLHYDPSSWGPDAHLFNPSRWDPANKDSFLQQFNTGVDYDNEDNSARLLKHRYGAWQPFHEGFRKCLGQKFAQVEFVATMSVVMRRYRCELRRGEQETWGEARERARRALDTSTARLTASPEEGMPHLVFYER